MPDRGLRTTVVTGGAGFVGRHLVASLARAGHRTIVVDRAFDTDLELFWGTHGPSQLVEADARDLSGAVNEPVQYVVHAAAVTGSPEETGSEPEAQFVEAVDTLGTVLQWARHTNVVRTVLVSSGAVFAGSRDRLRDENTPPVPISLYASAKRAAELFGEAMRRLHGLEVVAVRLANVYGPGERVRSTRPRTSLVHRMLREGIDSGSIRAAGIGDSTDWTFAADIGDAMVALLEAPRLEHGLYHLTSEEMLTERGIARLIAAALTEAGQETTVVELENDTSGGHGALVGARAHLELDLEHWTPFGRGVRETVAHALPSRTEEQTR